MSKLQKLGGNMTTRKGKRAVFIVLALLPVFVVYTVIVLYPLIDGLIISFFDWSGLTAHRDFVGTANYQKAWENHQLLLKAFGNDMFFAVCRIVCVATISFFFAEVICRMQLKESGFYRVVFFFPNVLSAVIISTLWLFIFNPQFGLFNGLLEAVGLESWTKPWLSDLNTVRWAIIPPMVWAQVGFYMVIYIAAIKGIPASYYEAATVDGASYFKQLTKITIPLVWSHIRTTLLLMVVSCFSANFSMVNVMTNGGPGKTTWVLMKELYDSAFSYHDYGYAATIGVIITVIALIYTQIISRLTKSEKIEY